MKKYVTVTNLVSGKLYTYVDNQYQGITLKQGETLHKAVRNLNRGDTFMFLEGELSAHMYNQDKKYQDILILLPDIMGWITLYSDRKCQEFTGRDTEDDLT